MAIAMTMKNASQESGLSARILYRLISEGKLKSTTVGRRRLVLTKSLIKIVTRGVPAEKNGANKERASAEPQRRKAARGAK